MLKQGTNETTPIIELEAVLDALGVKWELRESTNDGMTRYRVGVDENATVSIIRGGYSYGGDEGLFEMALVIKGKVIDDSVTGHIELKDVGNVINDLIKTIPQYA